MVAAGWSCPRSWGAGAPSEAATSSGRPDVVANYLCFGCPH